MANKKLDPDSNEAFLRDLEFHGVLPLQEAHIKGTARIMDNRVLTGTQQRVEFLRAHLAQHPEQGTADTAPAPPPKYSHSELRKMSASAKLDVSNDVPPPTLNGLKAPK